MIIRRTLRFCAAGLVALTLAGGAGALADEAAAEEETPPTDKVIANLSQHEVSLTAGFSGSEIFVYGAIKRVDPRPESAENLGVIITVTGPMAPVTVYKKERNFGIWTNGPPVRIDAAPSFYVVASTGEFRDTISWTDDLRYHIGPDYIIRLIDAPVWVENRTTYDLAVARIRERKGLYSVLPNSVEVIENTLFQTTVDLPADLTEGDYTARVFLTRNKQVLDVYIDTIEVRRALLGRFIYTAATEHPALYGLASLAVALIAGWLASAFFRTFFPI